MDHWKKLKKEMKKKSREKLNYKHNGMKPMGCSKTVLRGKIIAIKPHLK